jgi:hypothetical protein
MCGRRSSAGWARNEKPRRIEGAAPGPKNETEGEPRRTFREPVTRDQGVPLCR